VILIFKAFLRHELMNPSRALREIQGRRTLWGREAPSMGDLPTAAENAPGVVIMNASRILVALNFPSTLFLSSSLVKGLRCGTTKGEAPTEWAKIIGPTDSCAKSL
jgi:hypothetical protein